MWLASTEMVIVAVTHTTRLKWIQLISTVLLEYGSDYYILQGLGDRLGDTHIKLWVSIKACFTVKLRLKLR
jgi:hypothetical protein